MSRLMLRERDLAVLRQTLGRFPFVAEARVFGSRATGSARRASDLDLAVSAPAADRRQWADLCAALEEAPLIYELDVVRVELAASPRLQEKIARDGVRVFPVDAPAPAAPGVAA
ncbi:MAG: hypothetical protein RLZZ412_1082 [Verrucomicrobiota bacterium]|jgi:predicted nucleotidyltransferase